MWLIVLLLLTVLFIVIATNKLKLHPFLALLIAAFGYGLLSLRMSLQEVVDAVNAGFGGTIGQIGIVILAGSVIGTFLDKSGGAARIAERTVRLVGGRNVPLAMSVESAPSSASRSSAIRVSCCSLRWPGPSAPRPKSPWRPARWR